MKDGPKSYFQEIEVLALRLGIIGILLSVTMFVVGIGAVFLVVSAKLSSVLQAFDWGSTFLTIAISTLISILVWSKLLSFVKDSLVIGEKFLRIPLEKVIYETSTLGVLIWYFVFGSFSGSLYIGQHVWAYRIIEFGGYSSRIFVSESITFTLLMVITDWASALGALGVFGFTLTAYFRIFSLLYELQFIPKPLLVPIRKWMPLLAAVTSALPNPPTNPELSASTNFDSIDYNTLTEFTSRIAVGAVALGIALLGMGHAIGQITIHRLLFVAVLIVAVTSVCGFLTGFLSVLAEPLLERVVSRPIPDIEQLAERVMTKCRLLRNIGLMNTIRPDINMFVGVLWFIVAGSLYLLALGELPVARARYPPFSLFLPSSVSQVPVWLIDDIVFSPINYFEAARISAVIAMLATGVTLSYHGKHCVEQSRVTKLPDHLRRTLYKIALPLRVFDNKITRTDGPSKWSIWVRGGLFIQLIGIVGILQSVSFDQSVWKAMAVLELGVLVQALFAALEVRVRYNSSAQFRRIWPLALILLPLISGVAYILIEY